MRFGRLTAESLSTTTNSTCSGVIDIAERSRAFIPSRVSDAVAFAFGLRMIDGVTQVLGYRVGMLKLLKWHRYGHENAVSFIE